MHGNKRKKEKGDELVDYIRKGPWKKEEDEVLLSHVSKYGPRDWSSIRSKGLLQRTGKSCRLRWVNKLRPNLKNGCKFTAEEERVVIELQAQFGNKWAKIASYLSGRTDNDVKNFWSSRQKRLARILQASSSTSNSKSHRNKPKPHHLPNFQAAKLSSSSEGESSSSKPQPCSFSCNDNSEVIKMVALPDLFKPELPNSEPEEFAAPLEINKSSSNMEQTPFPNELQTDLTPFSFGDQDLLARIDDPSFADFFGPLGAYELGLAPQHTIGFPFFDPSEASCRMGSRLGISKSYDSVFDDFPVDMFDQMDPPSIPSKL
ncbi:hypothetical protein PIB30_036986 [Stylosanthes scabra]|uniref:Uncharacterized protein n=1 Tax=Stylosanthes scabra TaxID=79078 RepID=A0ABU6YDU8_9FABA|nr:hypothetical protein [Stylosanthes scabra]